MPDGAERGIFAGGPKREFVQIGLADDHRACVAKARDDGRILGGNMPLAHTGGGRRRNAPDVDDVLDGDWDTVQRSAIAVRRELAIGEFRVPSCRVCHDANERIERRLPFVDTLKTSVGDLERGHFTRAKLAGEFLDRHYGGKEKRRAENGRAFETYHDVTSHGGSETQRNVDDLCVSVSLRRCLRGLRDRYPLFVFFVLPRTRDGSRAAQSAAGTPLPDSATADQTAPRC